MAAAVDTQPPIGDDESNLLPFSSPLHEARLAAILGATLGICFTICFSTGLLSHLIQHPPSWFEWSARPAGFYRVTQGVHVVTGFATIPLLAAKLWVVAPEFWTTPPVRNAAHALERLSLVPLVAGSIFLLFSGVLNVARWYPWDFFFPAAHYWAAWIAVGGLIIHIGAKFATSRAALARRPSPEHAVAEPHARRGFVVGVLAAMGVMVLATIGNTVRPLSRFSVLAQRRPGTGPQGLPVNKSAASARVTEAEVGDDYRLRVSGLGEPVEFTLEELAAMPQRTAVLPIACVEGWSQSATWTGVPLAELLALVGAPDGASVRVESLQIGGLYRRSEVNTAHAEDPDTLLALRLEGEPLHLDHGYPVRLIGPNRPGVMQTKWVNELVVNP